MINYKVKPMLPGSMSLTTKLAYEAGKNMLQEKIQAGAPKPDSPNFFSAALSRPPPVIVMDSLYIKLIDKFKFFR